MLILSGKTMQLRQRINQVALELGSIEGKLHIAYMEGDTAEIEKLNMSLEILSSYQKELLAKEQKAESLESLV